MFTVTPVTGLDVRTHTAIVTVTGGFGIYAEARIEFEVTPKPITVNPSDIYYAGKVFDGTTTVDGPAVIQLTSASGVLARDVGKIIASYETAAYDNPNAGSRNVTFSGLALRGAAAVNYVLTNSVAVKPNVTITRRELVVKVNNRLTMWESETCADISSWTMTQDAYTIVGLVGEDTPESVIAEGGVYVMIALPDEYYDEEVSSCEIGNLHGTYPAVGTYIMTISGATFPNYYTAKSLSGTLTVTGKTDISDNIVIDGTAFVYNGLPQSPTFMYNDEDSTVIDTEKLTLRFIGVREREGGGGVAYDSIVPPTDAGVYKVEARYEDDDANTMGKRSVEFVIAPRPLAIARVAHTKHYDGARNAMGATVEFAVGDPSGIVEYFDDDGNVIALDNVVALDDIAVRYVSAMYSDVNAGTTSLTILNVSLRGDQARNYIVETPANFSVAGITKKPITPEMFTIARQTFTGSELRPVPVGLDGSNIVTLEDPIGPYTSNVYAGTATVRVVGAGNYIGTLTLDFEIAPKQITPAMFSISAQNYTGSELRPVPSATDGNNVVTFVVEGYEQNVNVGTGFVNIRGTGNYRGTLHIGFAIRGEEHHRDHSCDPVWVPADPDDPDNHFGEYIIPDLTHCPAPWNGTGSVKIIGWNYNDEPNAPIIFSSTNRHGRDDVTVEYKLIDAGDEEYSPNVPENAGYYNIRVTFPETINRDEHYRQHIATAEFRISKIAQDRPDVPCLRTLDRPAACHPAASENFADDLYLGMPLDIHTVAPDVPRIPAVISGLSMTVTDRAMSIAFADSLEMETWEYCILGGNNYVRFDGGDDPLFDVIPNEEYEITIRKRETTNYFASLPVVVLVRTATVGDGTPQVADGGGESEGGGEGGHLRQDSSRSARRAVSISNATPRHRSRGLM